MCIALKSNMIPETSQYEDLKGLMLGEVLGMGIHRKVGVLKTNNKFVIKCALEYPEINLLENEIWNMVKETDIAKWFAPVYQISPCGMFMIQERAETRPKSEYPKYVPSFFGDMKYKNYGWINGNFVCVDYAGFIASSMSHKWSGKMKKADWWE